MNKYIEKIAFNLSKVEHAIDKIHAKGSEKTLNKSKVFKAGDRRLGKAELAAAVGAKAEDHVIKAETTSKNWMLGESLDRTHLDRAKKTLKNARKLNEDLTSNIPKQIH